MLSPLGSAWNHWMVFEINLAFSWFCRSFSRFLTWSIFSLIMSVISKTSSLIPLNVTQSMTSSKVISTSMFSAFLTSLFISAGVNSSKTASLTPLVMQVSLKSFFNSSTAQSTLSLSLPIRLNLRVYFFDFVETTAVLEFLYFVFPCLKASTIAASFTTSRTFFRLAHPFENLVRAAKIKSAEIRGGNSYSPVPIAGSETVWNDFESACSRHFSRHIWRCLGSEDAGIICIMWRAFNLPPLVITTDPACCVPSCLHSCFRLSPHTLAIALLTPPAFSMSISELMIFTIASDSSLVRSPWTTSTLICCILILRLHPLWIPGDAMCFCSSFSPNLSW